VKTHLLIAASLLLQLTASAQTYRPFPEGDAQWREFSTALYCCGPGSNTVERHRIYYFDADTVIDGLTYHTILFDETSTTTYIWDPWPPYTSGQTGTLGTYLRQDTATRRVYQWTSFLGDTLLYDFNMGVGAYPATSIEAAPLQVVTIDSVALGDGWHKRWVLDVTDMGMTPYAMIEGVGSTFGLLGPMHPPFEASQDLMCFTLDTLPIYENTQLGFGCDFTVDMARPWHRHQPMAYPNPFTTEINVVLPANGGSTRFRLLNMTGDVILQGHTTGRIDASMLAPGSYVLEWGAPHGPTRQALVKV
jgi:hypothetical protein